MEKVSFEELNNYTARIKEIITKTLDSVFKGKTNDNSTYGITEIENLKRELFQIDFELRTLLKDIHYISTDRIISIQSPQELCRMSNVLIREIDEYIEKSQKDELKQKRKHLFINKIFFKGDPELFKMYLFQLVIHDVIQCNTDDALSLQDDIVFIGEYPEKNIIAFMRFLFEKGLIETDDNKTIKSCFKNEFGIWDSVKLNKNRSKFKNGESRNHIKNILENIIIKI